MREGYGSNIEKVYSKGRRKAKDFNKKIRKKAYIKIAVLYNPAIFFFSFIFILLSNYIDLGHQGY